MEMTISKSSTILRQRFFDGNDPESMHDACPFRQCMDQWFIQICIRYKINEKQHKTTYKIVDLYWIVCYYQLRNDRKQKES